MNTYIIKDCNATLKKHSGSLELNINDKHTLITDKCTAFSPFEYNGILNIACAEQDNSLNIYDALGAKQHFSTEGIASAFHIMNCPDGFRLIYTSGNDIAIKSRTGLNSFSQGKIIGRAKPICTEPFRSVGCGSRCLLFYVRCMPEQQLGYCEISCYKTGNFKSIYSTGYNIQDYSIFVSDELLLCALTINKGLTTALVFIRCDSNGIYSKTIYDSMGIKLCNIAFRSQTIYISWLRAGRLCSMYSSDMGESFFRLDDLNASNCTRAASIYIFGNRIDYSEQLINALS